MPQPGLFKPTHKAIKQFYETLRRYGDHRVKHEGALETAFQRLLDAAGRVRGWQLIPKQSLKVGKATIIPDGTLRDMFQARCGFWEAKDTDDDLNQEISNKIAKGYPTSNNIFEDTQTAVLFQGKIERRRYDLAKPKDLVDLLNDFFCYTEPEIDSFHHAVEEFKEDKGAIPYSVARLPWHTWSQRSQRSQRSEMSTRPLQLMIYDCGRCDHGGGHSGGHGGVQSQNSWNQ